MVVVVDDDDGYSGNNKGEAEWRKWKKEEYKYDRFP